MVGKSSLTGTRSTRAMARCSSSLGGRCPRTIWLNFDSWIPVFWAMTVWVFPLFQIANLRAMLGVTLR